MNNKQIIFMENGNKMTLLLDNYHYIITIKRSETRTYLMNLILDYNKTGNEELLKAIKLMVTPGKVLIGTELINREGKLYLKDSTIQLPEALANRVQQYLEDGYDLQPLINFWKNCLEHPYPKSIEELFEFCSINNMPLTPEGHIIGYKKLNYVHKTKFEEIESNRDFENLRIDSNGMVRGLAGKFVSKELATRFIDFIQNNADTSNDPLLIDVWSNTIKQRIGEWVEQALPEGFDWDSAKREECGVGLHVGSFDYSFSGNVRVLVEVRPQDVIAANTNYKKFRCIKYKNVCIINEKTEIKELVLE